MSSLRLRLRGPLEARVDLSGITPSRLGAMEPEAIARIELPHGSRAGTLGDLFDVSAGDGDGLVIHADDRLDGIGAEMDAGEIIVEGSCGLHAGAGMSGGRLVVRGDCGAFAGAGMSGGRIEIAGKAGDDLGGARAGERRGMAGGTIVVAGDVGSRAGARMRAGLIVIGGSAGPGLATSMIAGTIAVAGKVGPDAGRAMRRGTILTKSRPEGLALGFADTGGHDLVFLRLISRRVPDIAAWLGGAPASEATRLAGPVFSGGQGEILVVER